MENNFRQRNVWFSVLAFVDREKILEFWYVEYGKEELLIFLTSTFRSMFHEVFSDSVNRN